MSNNTKAKNRRSVASGFIRTSCATAVLAAVISTASAAGVNPDPGDYTALPPGTQLGVVYFQHLSADEVHARGKKIVNNVDLTLDLGILRYVHFVKIGDWVADPQIIVPFGRQKIGLADDVRSGLGDITVGAAFWPLHDLEGRHHFGISTFVTLPTGSEKDAGFALSANRYAFNLQAGYMRPLGRNWTIDLVAQSEFYSDQRNTDARKDAYFSLEASPRYHFSDATSVTLTWRHGWGGKETLNGSTLLDSEQRDSVILTWASFLSPKWQLQMQYRQDFDVQDGPALTGLQTRLLYVF